MYYLTTQQSMIINHLEHLCHHGITIWYHHCINVPPQCKAVFPNPVPGGTPTTHILVVSLISVLVDIPRTEKDWSSDELNQVCLIGGDWKVYCWCVSRNRVGKHYIKGWLTHQWCLTQQFAASNQVTNGNVEIGMSTTPVGDFGEGMSAQNVLQTNE